MKLENVVNAIGLPLVTGGLALSLTGMYQDNTKLINLGSVAVAVGGVNYLAFIIKGILDTRHYRDSTGGEE